jgi:NADH-quinone oxidoreductase subunit N
VSSWAVSLRLAAVEEFLSAAGLVLLLVSAWAGDKAARAITWAAAAALIVAAWLSAPALTGSIFGPEANAFFGQYLGDSFAAYAKLLIYGSAAVALVLAPTSSRRRAVSAPNIPSWPVCGAGHGADGVGGRSAHAVYRPRNELAGGLCAGGHAAHR